MEKRECGRNLSWRRKWRVWSELERRKVGRLLVELEENEKRTGGNGEELKRKKVELDE